MAGYVPAAGGIVWLPFNPQGKHEQAGHRSALVLSPATYKDRTGLMLCCPMTTRIKGYPFEVLIAGQEPSAILANQVKSLDWSVSRAVRKGWASTAELAEVRAKLLALIGSP